MNSSVIVRVGSRNPAKLEAVRSGLAPFFASVVTESAEIPSGVDAQPLGWAEIIAGARSRARGAHRVGPCDLAAGIEDGLIQVPDAAIGWVNIGCCVLFDGAREAVGFTAGFSYPPECIRRATANERTPIGDAFDSLYRAPAGLTDPGSAAGNIGRLSGGVLTRAEYGAQAVVCAFVRWLHPDLYRSEPGAGAPA